MTFYPNKVFVFGSNLLGIHGKGAALEAKQKWGAIQGIGYGRMGNSFAIPTKETPYTSLPLNIIQHYIMHFLDYALFSDSEFFVTPIGCGLAGYTPEQIAPFFKQKSSNVMLPEVFLLQLGLKDV